MVVRCLSELGDRLKSLRGQRRWTLAEVANKLGLKGHSTYSNWEYGRTEPDSQMLAKLAEVYETSVEYIITGENPPATLNKTSNNTPDFATSKDKRDLKKFLEQSEVMFDGVPLTEEDVETVQNLMQRMFWRAKEKNKRKPKDDT